MVPLSRKDVSGQIYHRPPHRNQCIPAFCCLFFQLSSKSGYFDTPSPLQETLRAVLAAFIKIPVKCSNSVLGHTDGTET